MFGPVALGTNRCGKDLPALLEFAEEGLDEALMLGGLQDGIPINIQYLYDISYTSEYKTRQLR